MDKSGFLQVDLNRVGYKDESFILASQARQVFYVNDPKSTKWSIVLFSNKVIDENTGDQGDIDVEIESFTRNDQDENIISNDYILEMIIMRVFGSIQPSVLLRDM